MSPLVIINPGTGPVDGASRRHAGANMQQLVVDAGVPEATLRFMGARMGYGTDRPDGRFSFVVRLDERECEVDMPGLPLDRVRYVGGGDQNIWDFPRLYVQGSSWVWCYAAGSLADALRPEDDAA